MKLSTYQTSNSKNRRSNCVIPLLNDVFSKFKKLVFLDILFEDDIKTRDLIKKLITWTRKKEQFAFSYEEALKALKDTLAIARIITTPVNSEKYSQMILKALVTHYHQKVFFYCSGYCNIMSFYRCLYFFFIFSSHKNLFCTYGNLRPLT